MDHQQIEVVGAHPLQAGFHLSLAGIHVSLGGVDHLLTLGSTGEAGLLTEVERDALIETTVEMAGDKTVIVGTTHASTAVAVRYCKRAAELGAQALLVATPGYLKPEVAGLVEHYSRCADAAPDLPIIAYNIPGRTGLNMGPRTMEALWAIPQVVALKESSADLAQIGRVAVELPEGKTLLSGDDPMALASIAVGATGLVSVTANVLPSPMKDMVTAACEGRLRDVQRAMKVLLPVMDALFLESNPIPVKSALSLIGIGSDQMRLPLTTARPETRARLAEVLRPFHGHTTQVIHHEA